MIVRVSAPCRLHFGLFHVPADSDPPGVRKFGGVGLMIRQPRIDLALTPSNSWQARGPLGGRAVRFAEKVIRDRRGHWPVNGPLRVIADGPDEHVGLGVGTALGMAVAAALCCDRIGIPDVEVTARLAGRGERSGVGAHGFYRGGYLVDDGRVGNEFPALADRLPLPDGWRVVLVRPPGPTTWHGDRERAAFARGRSAKAAADSADRLRRIAADTLTPAVELGLFDEFAAAVSEFNRAAGESFAADQGGPYAGPAVAATVELLRSFGAVGVGQSSWGPTVFAFARDGLEADHLARRARAAMPAGSDVTVAEPDNAPAWVRQETDADQAERFEGEWRSAGEHLNQPDQEHVRGENQ